MIGKHKIRTGSDPWPSASERNGPNLEAKKESDYNEDARERKAKDNK